MRGVFPRACRGALVLAALATACVLRAAPHAPQKLDPAAWGGDHVGKPVPEYMTGGDCLFCHRNDVGPSWGKNRHQTTVREAESGAPELAALKESPELKAFAGEVTLLMGGKRTARFLKKSAAYGKADLLTEALDRQAGGGTTKFRPTADGKPHWDGDRFADACAGCHATAVDPSAKAFATLALDCFACHGDVPSEHAKDTSQVFLSKKRQDSARVVASICGSCHVRTGKSKATGLPYPDNFVAGDNVFRDFRADFSDAALAALNPADRHVMENVRDVVVLGKEEVTCLSCHDVHKQSSKKHTRVAEDDSCVTCHNETGSKKKLKTFEVHSKTCEY